jgi:hypothetical protein
MRRSAMVGAALTAGTMLGVLAPAAGSTAAWADGPQHVKSTFLFDNFIPASTLCDFDFHNVFAGSDNTVIFPDRTIDHVTVHAIDTNLATGFTLTDTDHFTVVTATDGQQKSAGLIFHLRTTDGKLVVNQAGLLVFSATGDVLKVTPSINPNDRATLCTALGGHPAF